MTTASLIIASSTSIIDGTIGSEGAVNSSYANKTLTLSQPTTYRAGQVINSKLYTLGTDYALAVGNGIQNSASGYAYNASAQFFTVTYTPLSSSSLVNIYSYWQCIRLPSTGNKTGILVCCYSSTASGSLPLVGNIAGTCGAIISSPSQEYSCAPAVNFYQNSGTAALSFYFCAFFFGNLSGQRILSSTSTATTFAGSLASSVRVEEIYQ